MLYKLATGLHPTIRKTIGRLKAFHRGELTDQHQLLANLLDHATASVPFYRSLKSAEFRSFPVTSKSEIKQDYNLYLSDRYDPKKLHWVKTSGSSGTPFDFALDIKKKTIRTAEMIFYNGWAGYNLGDHIVVNAVGAHKSLFARIGQRCTLTDPTYIDDIWHEKQRGELKKRSRKLLICYASTLRSFTEYCRGKGDTRESFNLKGIVCTSENLDSAAKRAAEVVFGCPVLSRYSSQETGVIAQECPIKGSLHLNCANYIVEILDMQSDSPAAPGEIGRLVVTDLFNYGLPLIRYDIGDLAIMNQSQCSCGSSGPILESLLGRKTENITTPDNKVISWVSINDMMWGFPEIKQFQFIQHDFDTYQLKLVLYRQDLQKELLLGKLDELLGKKAKIAVVIVSAIPQSGTGKTPYIVNKFVANTVA